MTYSHWARRIRLPLGFLLAVLYLVFARPTRATFVVGGVVAFIGLLVRGWAAGHIMKNDRLATTGPYAHTRNPLYFGSFLIAAGFAIAAHWSLLLVVIAFWVLVYGPTIERERIAVEGRFPEQYREYAANVPVFFPRPTPWQRSEGDGSFSYDLYMRHREWQAALGYLAAMTLLWLRMTGVF